MRTDDIRVKQIPVVDPGDPEIIGRAFHDIGFVFIRAPEVTVKLAQIYDEFGRLFNLPPEVKAKYAHPEIHYQRGWTPSFTEKAIMCRRLGVDGSDLPDAKEAWFIGPELSADHYLVRKYPTIYPANIWPEEAPGFRPAMELLYRCLFDFGKKILPALDVCLRRPGNYFSEMVRDSPTLMRAIHYPPLRAEDIGKIIWACKHTDINLITILPASTRPGLWIRRRDGQWIPGNAPEGCIIAQVGDMLQYLSGGEFLSAVHEVRAPDQEVKEGRFSAALFIHARSDFLFEPVVPEAKRIGYPSITAGELLLQRLKAIGLA